MPCKRVQRLYNGLGQLIEPACHVFGQSKICPLNLQKALDSWESFHSHCFVTAMQLGFRGPVSNSNFFHLLSPTPRSPPPLVTCLDCSGCGLWLVGRVGGD
jgi:hypothetical protein